MNTTVFAVSFSPTLVCVLFWPERHRLDSTVPGWSRGRTSCHTFCISFCHRSERSLSTVPDQAAGRRTPSSGRQDGQNPVGYRNRPLLCQVPSILRTRNRSCSIPSGSGSGSFSSAYLRADTVRPENLLTVAECSNTWYSFHSSPFLRWALPSHICKNSREQCNNELLITV